MERIFEVLIDVMNKRQNTVVIKQKDKGATYIRFTIMNQSQPMDMSSVRFATIKGIKPDKTIIYADADIIKDTEGKNTNIVEYRLSDEVAAVAGKSTYELTLSDANAGVITSFDFYISVNNLLYDEEDYISKDDVSGFRAYMTRTLNAALKTESFAESFREAYGDEKEITQLFRELYAFYLSYIDDLQRRVDEGEFKGEKGERGERGSDAVVSEEGYICGFEIINRHLIGYCSDANDFALDERRHLIIQEGE